MASVFNFAQLDPFRAGKIEDVKQAKENEKFVDELQEIVDNRLAHGAVIRGTIYKQLQTMKENSDPKFTRLHRKIADVQQKLDNY